MKRFLLFGVALLGKYYSVGALPVDAEIPNDPEFFRQWGLEQINNVDIDVITAWTMLTGKEESAPIVVAVMDGSIELDNMSEFEGRTVPGCDIKEAYKRLGSAELITMDECKEPKLELHAHGNGVAGIIAAKYDNSKRITGVAGPYPIKIMPLNGKANPVHFVNPNPSDFHLNDQYFAAAVKFAADNGARIFCTAVGYTPIDVDTEVMREAVQYANAKGMLLVVSAGNVDPNVGSGFPTNPFNPDVLPGSLVEPNVISVGSINLDGHLAVNWDDGAPEFQDGTYYGRYVDVAAPGVAITTTDDHFLTDIITSLPLVSGQFEYGIAGNSFASPVVAGIAALTLLAFPQLTVDQLKQALKTGVQQTDELMTEVCYCAKAPTEQLQCYSDCDPDDEKMRTRLVQFGGYIRAPLVLEEAGRILGETITLNGEPVGSYPKSAFSVKKDGVEPDAHIRNWDGLETGDGEEVAFSAVPHPDYEYAWEFGDGITDVGQNVAHVYTSPGVYYANLTVTDVKTSLQDVSPPLRVTVYPQNADYIRIRRADDQEETVLADTYFIHSSFDIRANWFGDHRVTGSGYFEVGGTGYSLKLETEYPVFGVSLKMFDLEEHGGDSTSRLVWTIGGIQFKEHDNGSETMTVHIPPYKFTITVST